MPADLKRMIADRVELTVKFTDDPADDLHIVYKPSAYTRQMERAYRAALENGAAADAFAKVLAPLVVQWDLTDGGEPVPCTEAGIDTIPVDLLIPVAKALVGDIASDPKRSYGRSSGT